MRHLLFIFFSAMFFCSTSAGQQPTATPSQERPMVRLGPIPTLKEELGESQVEPRLKKFRMNLHFLRAKYSQPKFEGGSVHQYVWEYFAETFVIIQIFEYPVGHLSNKSVPEKEQLLSHAVNASIAQAGGKKLWEKNVAVGSEAGKEFEFVSNGVNKTFRMFTKDDVMYILIAQPKQDGADQLIEKLFDSFEFVK